MKISELRSDESSFSCEFFPPRTDAGMANLIGRAERLARLGARFVSVTWGAGGTSADRSVELAHQLAKSLGPKVPIVLHLTCTNMSRDVLDATLRRIAAPDSGIDNILALRGDRPREDYYGGGSGLANSEFEWAEDLVRYVRQQYGERFCIGVAAYPEGFTDSPTLIPDVNRDLEHLADKVAAGAEFVMTQLFYDPAKYAAYVDKVRRHPRLGPEIAEERLFPGLMPLVSYRTFVRSAELSHASIPIQVLQDLKNLDTQDDDVVKRYGAEMLADLVGELQSQYGMRRFHFFTLNLERSLTEVLWRTGLAAGSTKTVDGDGSGSGSGSGNTSRFGSRGGSRFGSRNTSRRGSISASRGGSGRSSPRALTTAKPAEWAAPAGTAAAGWDEFVNGRYTDPASAAFGEIDGYGPIVHGAIGNKPNPAWGRLASVDDISQVFVRHITNELPAFPFGDEALSAETALIQEQLIELNLIGIWTLASQPAAHAQLSTDRILGWGPPGGRVYQQAYVEFLVDPEEWKEMRPRLEQDPNIVWYAASEHGEVETNSERASKHAVTWGVWDVGVKDSGSSIKSTILPKAEEGGENRVETTIVAYESFLAWRDETFGVLRGWQRLYSQEDPDYKLLGKVADTRLLVTALYKDTKEELKLWETILGE